MRHSIQQVVGPATSYTVAGFRIDPAEDEALELEGYHSPFTLYVLFNDGQVYAHHDRYKVVRAVGSDSTLLLDAFDEVQAKVVD